MKHISLLVALSLFAALPLTGVYAQGTSMEEETVLPVEGSATLEATTGLMDEGIGEADTSETVGVDADGTLTADEYEDLVADAEALTTTDLSDAAILEGEVVAVNETDDTVVVETVAGDLVTVPSDVFQDVASRAGGGGRLLNPKPGDRVALTAEDAVTQTGAVEVETNPTTGTKNVILFVVTDSGRTPVTTTGDVVVYRNGTRSAVASLTATDDVQLVQNSSGDVVAVYATSGADEGAAMPTEEQNEDGVNWWLIALAVLIVVGAGALFVRYGMKK